MTYNTFLNLFKQFMLLFTIIIVSVSCDRSTEKKPFSGDITILPSPKEISETSSQVFLLAQSEMYSSNADVKPLLEIFQEEIHDLTGVNLEISEEKNKNTDVLFEIDTKLAKEEYHVNIHKIIEITGGSYQALAMARTTLLQLATTQDGLLGFPMLTIKDYPDASYRGLMIDLARGWHPMASIKKFIKMASFYKSNYVHLHFTDYQSYTLPSYKYSKLSTPERSYSFEELEELEAYSQARGVTIIPEIDIPGHSSPLVEKYPEIFAIKDVKENPWIINMGNEETYEAIEVLISELMTVFKASPYFHIGGDEAIFYKVTDDPTVKAYMKKHQLGDDVHELYRHFIVRLNEIVKKHDKQMCVWEGFRREGNIEIPKDIIVFEFETNRYLPNHLVEDGYTVVNTSWKPLYVVNQKKWEPKTIYNWNMWRWENWFAKAPSIVPIQLKETPLVIGAQMCSWEQQDKLEIPSLRKRLPALNERIWNTTKKVSYDAFMKYLKVTDKQLSVLINDSRQDSLLLGYNFKKEKN
ncbi:family 20 glycosylhydrolase [Flavivirga rizhaonensis]|uniref:beta-N-acetylhexosaminidase n=1 Tax=Flavivirga rizhaonensis TaxID=2559571 RepID=A0A4S1E3Q9_9FLAO|nr:family 20 glycosylhydrolase [Flavivirga rizhaonensis]TGV04612.1 hypothetical protein EM932_00355 [Flavivirga rizhaonensis]